MLVLVMLSLIMQKWFLWIVWFGVLKIYGGKDVKKIPKDTWIFNYANACIKFLCITYTMDFHVLIIHSITQRYY